MRFLVVLYLFVVGILALLAEMILPAHIRFLSDIGFASALIPLVVIYASLELGDERALILAGLLGLLLDLTSSPPHRLGISLLILSSLSALIVSQAYRPESHQWAFRLTFVLVGTFAFLLLDYLFAQIEMSTWRWPLEAWSKITFASLLNLLLAFPFFCLISLPPRLCGWKPDYESTDRYRTYL